MIGKHLTDDEYRTTYSLVPRLCVDLLIRGRQGVLLTRRKQKPHVGTWHLPGGRVRRGETIEQAAQRIAVSELGVGVLTEHCLGFMEFLDDRGDLVTCHSVSVVLSCKVEQEDSTPPDSAWFLETPVSGVLPIHQKFLLSMEAR